MIFDLLIEFRESRGFTESHTPTNLAKSITIESAELLELYQWEDNPDLDRVSEELADVLIYCYNLAERLKLDPVAIMLDKIEANKAKYPLQGVKNASK